MYLLHSEPSGKTECPNNGLPTNTPSCKGITEGIYKPGTYMYLLHSEPSGKTECPNNGLPTNTQGLRSVFLSGGLKTSAGGARW